MRYWYQYRGGYLWVLLVTVCDVRLAVTQQEFYGLLQMRFRTTVGNT